MMKGKNQVSSLLLPGWIDDAKRPTIFSKKRQHPEGSVLANVGNNMSQQPSRNNGGLFAFAAKEHDEKSFDDITCSLHKRMTRVDKRPLEKKENSQLVAVGLSSMFSTERQHHQVEKSVHSSKQPPRVKRKPRKKLRRDTQKSIPAKARYCSNGKSLLVSSMESEPTVCRQRRTKNSRNKQQLTHISTLLVGGVSPGPYQRGVTGQKPKKSLEHKEKSNLAMSSRQRQRCAQTSSGALPAESRKGVDVKSTKETAISSSPTNSNTVGNPCGAEVEPPSPDSVDPLPLPRRSNPPRDPTPCKNSLQFSATRSNSHQEKQWPTQRRKPRDPSPCRRLSNQIRCLDPLPRKEQSAPDIQPVVQVSSICEELGKCSTGVGLKRGAQEDPPSIEKRIDQKKSPLKRNFGNVDGNSRSLNCDVPGSQKNAATVPPEPNNRFQSTPAVFDNDDGISDISMTPALCDPKLATQSRANKYTDLKPSPNDQRRRLFSHHDENIGCQSLRSDSNCLVGDDNLEVLEDQNPQTTSEQEFDMQKMKNAFGDGEAEVEGSAIMEVEYCGGGLFLTGLSHRESPKAKHQTISSIPRDDSTVLETADDTQERSEEESTESFGKPCTNGGPPRRTGRVRKATDRFKFSDGITKSDPASKDKDVIDKLITGQRKLATLQGHINPEDTQIQKVGVCSVLDTTGTEDVIDKLKTSERLTIVGVDEPMTGSTSKGEVPNPPEAKASNQTTRRSGRQRKKTEHFLPSCDSGPGPTPTQSKSSKPRDGDSDITSTTESDEDFSPRRLPVANDSQKQAKVENNEATGKFAVNRIDDLGLGAKPRRAIRRTNPKVPVLKKKFAILAPSEWSPELLEKLREAHAAVNPTSPTFWHKVAHLVQHKTAKECREMWFSFSKTPKTKETKKANGPARLPADDIFQSTPLRCLAQSAKINATACNEQQASKRQLPAAEDDSSPGYDTGPTKRGYKTYLNNMRKDVARAEKVKQKVAPYKEGGAKTLSEYDAGAELRVRLTPGGTLKIRRNEEQDACDFDDEEEEDDSMME